MRRTDAETPKGNDLGPHPMGPMLGDQYDRFENHKALLRFRWPKGVPCSRSLNLRSLGGSFLREEKPPLRYSEKIGFDNDLSTSRVEGKEGPGIGERIAFDVPPLPRKIAVFPG